MTTPMMQQWRQCKKMAPDSVLFFRMGDFYEAFHEDASLVSSELDITLTQRQETPMAGVPAHAVDNYIDRLIAKGHRVAIAEQMEDPKQTKGLVRREVVKVVTPGTATESSLITDNANNFIACVSRSKQIFGLAFLDLSTAQFQVMESKEQRLIVDELHRLHASELVVCDSFPNKQADFVTELKSSGDPLISTVEDWRFEKDVAQELLKEHFGVVTLDGFGLQEMPAATSAAGALLHYLRDRLSQPLDHIRAVHTYHTGAFLAVDRATQRNLELTRSQREGTRKNTLLSCLDKTLTPMGGRLLQQWICQPLLEVSLIEQRQKAIGYFLKQRACSEVSAHHLSQVRDLERLAMKVSATYASPRDLVSLAHSLKALPFLRSEIGEAPGFLNELSQKIGDFTEISDTVLGTLSENPPIRLTDGGVIRKGVHPELDELKSLQADSKSWITSYQQSLRESLGIKTLKVGFNRMFGYYLEVSRGQAQKMPESFQRRQTLVNSERYLSPELKKYEQKILSAEERISSLEQELFLALRRKVASYTKEILASASAVATVDVLLGLSVVAAERGYTCPVVENSSLLQIKEGRHPVLESNHPFTPNSTCLDCGKDFLHLITGPNMGGKSTYIRQVALLVLMSQMGSYIPAKGARIGIVDRLFSRIGASDDLSAGQSTFMVEMTEAANILNNATERSLVILDEIGRGTSTYDGISIAWAIAEHLLVLRARTLFATHYFELTRLQDAQEGVSNYHVSAEEVEGNVVFLRKVVKGPADRSYGIHVGQLAGLPLKVIHRAEQLLGQLEKQKAVRIAPTRRRRVLPSEDSCNQLSLFEPITP